MTEKNVNAFRVIRCKKTVLVQFAKAPVPGAVKTRLLNLLSAEQAAELHCQLTRHCLQNLLSCQRYPVQLWAAGEVNHLFFKTLKEQFSEVVFAQQHGSDLGGRMAAMFDELLSSYERVLLIGSDCPFITAAYLEKAIAALKHNDVVLGPAADGGYVLIGLRRVNSDLFDGIKWGSEQVLQQTREAINALGWQFCELDVQSDIDRPEDLATLSALPEFKPWLSFC